MATPDVCAGDVTNLGAVTVEVSAGAKELTLEFAEARVSYPISVFETSEGMIGDVTVSHGPFDPPTIKRIEEQVRAGGRIVVLADEGPLPFFGETERIPTMWGPTPFFLGDGTMFDGLLGPELFHCFPKAAIPSVRGPVAVVVPPPIGKWGAVIAESSFGTGRLAVCLLPIKEGFDKGGGLEKYVLHSLVRRVGEEK